MSQNQILPKPSRAEQRRGEGLLSTALLALNEGDREQWNLRWARAQNSDGRECWRLENKAGHLRAEIHPGGDVERNIYIAGYTHTRLEELQALARVLWANAEVRHGAKDADPN